MPEGDPVYEPEPLPEPPVLPLPYLPAPTKNVDHWNWHVILFTWGRVEGTPLYGAICHYDGCGYNPIVDPGDVYNELMDSHGNILTGTGYWGPRLPGCWNDIHVLCHPPQPQ